MKKQETKTETLVTQATDKLADQLEALKSINGVGACNVPYIPPTQPCPSCGRCPTCGRGGTPYFQPYYIGDPPRPYTWQYTTGQGYTVGYNGSSGGSGCSHTV